jgi:hypothetical protein
VIVVLTPYEQFFSHIMVRPSYISMRWWWWWCSFFTRPTCLVGFFIVLAHWNNSLQVDMLLSQYPDSEVTRLYSYSSQRSCKYQFHSLWFDPIWFEPTIYHTLDKYVTHDLPHFRQVCYPRSTTLWTSMLPTIYHTLDKYVTHDLPHFRQVCYPRSTTL